MTFTFSGMLSMLNFNMNKQLKNLILFLWKACGVLIGRFVVFCNRMMTQIDPIGPPIHGALLSSDFIWWRPSVLGGVSKKKNSCGKNKN